MRHPLSPATAAAVVPLSPPAAELWRAVAEILAEVEAAHDGCGAVDGTGYGYEWQFSPRHRGGILEVAIGREECLLSQPYLDEINRRRDLHDGKAFLKSDGETLTLQALGAALPALAAWNLPGDSPSA